MKNKFIINLNSEELSSNSQKAVTLADSKKLGKLKNGKVEYSFYEAVYLVETGKADILKNNKKLTFNKIKKYFLKNKNSQLNYVIFKYLRKKGYVVKTGLKFGAEFRVYDKNKKHAKWIVYPVKHSEKINLKNFISKNRIAHSTAKKLLLAIMDSEEEIIFYEINWIKI